MNWNLVSIETTESAADLIASVLIDAGASGTELIGGSVPAASYDEYALPDAETESVYVSAYFGEERFDDTASYIKTRLVSLRSTTENPGTLEVTVSTVADTDWNENFKKSFTTFRAAGCFIIKPTWESYNAKDGDIVLELDPGMAFGTGDHESTRMCLELLQKYMTPGDTVLDIGCGSGILGIAAAKLGSRRVLALDNDIVSVGVSRNNAHANNVEKIEVRQSDLLQNADGGPYGVILANIVADILIRLNKEIKAYMRPDGIYILGGIIDERLDDVRASLSANGLKIIETLAMADWRALAVKVN